MTNDRQILVPFLLSNYYCIGTNKSGNSLHWPSDLEFNFVQGNRILIRLPIGDSQNILIGKFVPLDLVAFWPGCLCYLDGKKSHSNPMEGAQYEGLNMIS